MRRNLEVFSVIQSWRGFKFSSRRGPISKSTTGPSKGRPAVFFDEKSRGFLSHYFEFDHRQEARNLEVFLPKSILLEVEEDPLEWFWAI